MRKLLYVAAPFTNGDSDENTHLAIRVADIIYRETEYLPFIPHLNKLWHLVCPHEPRFWYNYDLEVLAHCDAIVRLPGLSPGADREMEMAEEINKEIVNFYDLPHDAQEAWLGVEFDEWHH